MKILFPTEKNVVVCKKCKSILTVNFACGEADDEDSYWCSRCDDYVDEEHSPRD